MSKRMLADVFEEILDKCGTSLDEIVFIKKVYMTKDSNDEWAETSCYIDKDVFLERIKKEEANGSEGFDTDLEFVGKDFYIHFDGNCCVDDWERTSIPKKPQKKDNTIRLN